MASGTVESYEQESEDKQRQQSPGAIQRAPLVQRLLDAPNLPAFVNDLITTQATTVAGTEAAGFLIERAEEGFSLRLLGHIRPDSSTAEVRKAAIQAFTDLIKPCVQEGKDGAIEIGPAGDVRSGEAQYCLVTLLRAEGEAVAVSAVVTRCMNLERARQRLSSMQLVAGYFELFTLRHNADQARLIAQSHQHVLQLATAVATAEGFESAAMNLCNELANRAGATRVALGWLKGKNIRVRALSHTEEFDKKQELIKQLENVMEECADQEEFVHFDPYGKSTENVTREAQALSRAQAGNIVLSLPLRHRADVCGVVTLEFLPNSKLGPQVAHGLAVAVELLAPQLYDRYQNDRWLITKAGLSTKHGLEMITGPKYTLAKVLIAVGVVGLIIICQPWWTPVYHVSAPFTFAAPNKYVVSAPFEARLIEVGRRDDGMPLRPGDKVKPGQLLAQLDQYELARRETDALRRENEAEQEEMKFRSTPGKLADALAAQYRAEAAKAEAQLYGYQKDHSRIVASQGGTILKGDLSEKIGSRLQAGEDMFQITPDDRLRPELTVSERDIQDVKVGASGRIATDALPMDKFGFKVTRIIPLGEAKEGSNSFVVYGEMDPSEVAQKHPTWRPGMAGEARVDVEHRTLIWIWTHRLVDFLRLKLWM